MDIEVDGSVQLFAVARRYIFPTKTNLEINTKKTKYWQTDDPNIQELANKLRTPENIFNFVKDTLSYNKNKLTNYPVRLGAKNSLIQSNNASCMEFTDLFVAIARSAGIPAREINGFAYTENPEIQPLSLVNDVLHAWPEYWDYSKNTWIPVDPTWGSTSGVDYFNKFDLRHIVFVIHGKDAEVPISPGSYKLGSNPQKDVFVNFGQLPVERNEQLKITYSLSKYFFITRGIDITLENIGISSIYNSSGKVYFDDKLVQENPLIVLPPYAKQTIKLFIPLSFLAKNTPKTIKIISANSEFTGIGPFKSDLLIEMTIIFLIITLIAVFILRKSGRIKFLKFLDKNYAKKSEETKN
jgi:hypothetical protein